MGRGMRATPHAFACVEQLRALAYSQLHTPRGVALRAAEGLPCHEPDGSPTDPFAFFQTPTESRHPLGPQFFKAFVWGVAAEMGVPVAVLLYCNGGSLVAEPIEVFGLGAGASMVQLLRCAEVFERLAAGEDMVLVKWNGSNHYDGIPRVASTCN